MAKLSPSTLTRSDQDALLEATASGPCEALLVSLGTGLRLAELVGLDVGDVYLPGGQPRVRVRLRAEIAKRGSACAWALHRTAGGPRSECPPPAKLKGLRDAAS